MIRCVFVAICLHVLVGAVPATEPAINITDTVKEAFQVRPGGSLVVEIDNGALFIETTSSNEVRVELERTVEVTDEAEARRIIERHDYSLRQIGNDVEIHSTFESGSSFWGRRNRDRMRLKVTIQIPEVYNVDFSSGAGNVRIADVGGTVSGRTGAGNITIGRVAGVINVSSGSGNVELTGAGGGVAISTGAGNVRLDELRGAAEVKTGAGNVFVYIADQPDDGSVLETGAGNITVFLSEDIRASVSAIAAVGSAQTDFPLEVEGKWMSRSIAGDLNGGGPQIRMRAGLGNIAVKRMP